MQNLKELMVKMIQVVLDYHQPEKKAASASSSEVTATSPSRAEEIAELAFDEIEKHLVEVIATTTVQGTRGPFFLYFLHGLKMIKGIQENQFQTALATETATEVITNLFIHIHRLLNQSSNIVVYYKNTKAELTPLYNWVTQCYSSAGKLLAPLLSELGSTEEVIQLAIENFILKEQLEKTEAPQFAADSAEHDAAASGSERRDESEQLDKTADLVGSDDAFEAEEEEEEEAAMAHLPETVVPVAAPPPPAATPPQRSKKEGILTFFFGKRRTANPAPASASTSASPAS